MVLRAIEPESAGLNALAHSTAIASLTATLAGMLGYLPLIITCIAGIFAASSYAVTIWESVTIQQALSRWTFNRRAKKIAKLRSRQAILAAKLNALETIKNAQNEAKTMITDAQNKEQGRT